MPVSMNSIDETSGSECLVGRAEGQVVLEGVEMVVSRPGLNVGAGAEAETGSAPLRPAWAEVEAEAVGAGAEAEKNNVSRDEQPGCVCAAREAGPGNSRVLLDIELGDDGGV